MNGIKKSTTLQVMLHRNNLPKKGSKNDQSFDFNHFNSKIGKTVK